MDPTSRIESGPEMGAAETGFLVEQFAAGYIGAADVFTTPESIKDDLSARIRAGEITDMDAANIAMYLGIRN